MPGCPDNVYDPAISFNKTLTYDGVAIPGVEVDTINKRITYNKNGNKVTTSFSGRTTFRSSRIPRSTAKKYKTAAGDETDVPQNTFKKVGRYIREVNPSGYTVGVKPLTYEIDYKQNYKNSSGETVKTEFATKYYVPDGVDRSKLTASSLYYKQFNDLSDGAKKDLRKVTDYDVTLPDKWVRR